MTGKKLTLTGINWLSTKRTIIIVAFVLVFAIFLTKMMVVVGPGQAGVIFDPLGGGVQDGELGEGLHIIMPWQSVDSYNVKLQDYTMSLITEEGALQRDDRIRCVTNEGLYLDLDMTIWYRIALANASHIRQNIGRDGEYQAIIVRPAIRSAIREVVSNYDAIDVYGANRELIVLEMYSVIKEALEDKHIELQDVLLRHVELPAKLTAAIEEKKKAEQEAQRMVYVLEIENLECARKIIEAVGISSANEIIAGSLSMEYLEWYWIANLDKHSSVIYVPVGEYGLPLFREVERGTENYIGGGAEGE